MNLWGEASEGIAFSLVRSMYSQLALFGGTVKEAKARQDFYVNYVNKQDDVVEATTSRPADHASSIDHVTE